jgi:predicted transcriptional regulator YdeE
MAVEQTDSVPDGLALRPVPASTYAVFECTLETIHDTWHRIFREWLPESGYVENRETGNFDWYPPDCDGRSTILLHLAVREKE